MATRSARKTKATKRAPTRERHPDEDYVAAPAKKKKAGAKPSTAELMRTIEKLGGVGAVVGKHDRPLLGGRIPKANVADLFKPYKPPPGVLPAGFKPPMAMDSVPANVGTAFIGQSFQNYAYIEGYAFLGYPYLAQLAQITEYRLVSDIIATECTRKWIEIKTVSKDKKKGDADSDKPEGANDLAPGNIDELDDEDDADVEEGDDDDAEEQDDPKLEKVKALEKELERLNVQGAYRTLVEHDGLYGIGHLYLDTGDTEDPAELKTDIGDGGEFTQDKFKPGFFRALKTVEPIWCYPSTYNASNPLADDWYNPRTWLVMGMELHRSRMLQLVARPVSDIFKPAFSFGGLSLSQMIKPYVDNWLQTRQSINDLIQAFSTMVLSTDLTATLETGGTELSTRIDLFQAYRNNRGLMVVSKDDEEFKNVSAPLGTLDALQAQSQEHICSAARIPLVKFTGLTPDGLNASSDGEIRVFYDGIHAYQEANMRPSLTVVFRLAQINLWGEVDEDLTYEFKPLWELDEKSLAELRKTEMETDASAIDAGILDPEESRQRIASDSDQPYGDIIPSKVPEPVGPEPGNVREAIKPEDDASAEGGPGAVKTAVPARQAA